MKTTLSIVCLTFMAVAMAIGSLQVSTRAERAVENATASKPDAAALERSRKMTQMLDNIYKQTVVLITDKYVHDTDDFAAGSAAVLLFENISKSGSHQVRLIDATGEPYDSKNVANNDFEREGIKKLKEGAKLHEQVVDLGGKPHLRTVTPVPVVMKKCIMCHEHYAEAKEGEPIGAISYTVLIE